MNMGKRLSELREADKISGESSYVIEMGDGTGTKQVKHKNLVGQLLEDMEMTYDETMELLGSTDGEGDKKIPNVKAISDWIASKITNNLLATEAGYFLDARQGPVIQGEIDSLTTKVNQINSNLNEAKQPTDIRFVTNGTASNCLNYITATTEDIKKLLQEESYAYKIFAFADTSKCFAGISLPVTLYDQPRGCIQIYSVYSGLNADICVRKFIDGVYYGEW